jgi:hypothetical protein
VQVPEFFTHVPSKQFRLATVGGLKIGSQNRAAMSDPAAATLP